MIQARKACTPEQVTPRNPSSSRLAGAPRGRKNTTPYEARERAAFALSLYEIGMSTAQVVRMLQLPPVRTGEIDKKTGQLKMGGLGLSRGAAVKAAGRALRRADARWTTNRAHDRISQKMILEAAIEGAMRDRKWTAVAALSHELARITGTHEPEEVVITTGDARRQAVMQVIASMSEDEFAELHPPKEPPLLPPH